MKVMYLAPEGCNPAPFTELDMLLEELADLLKKGDATKITVRVVKMTQREWQELPEWEGY